MSGIVLERWEHASPVVGVTLRSWRTPARGKPVLHFLHGNGFCARTYEPLLQLLAADFDLWLSDAPGHGDSDVPACFPGWNACALAALDAFQAHAAEFGDVPRLALGHSLGGVMTTLMLAEPDQPFTRAVLLDPVLFSPAMLDELGAPDALERSPLAKATLRRRRAWASRDEAANSLRGRGTYEGWTEPALQAFVTHALRDEPDGSVALKCPPELEAAIFSSAPTGLWEAVARVTTPTLIVHGSDSMPFVADSARRAAAMNAAITEATLPGGHCFMQQHPADTAARVRQYLVG